MPAPAKVVSAHWVPVAWAVVVPQCAVMHPMLSLTWTAAEGRVLLQLLPLPAFPIVGPVVLSNLLVCAILCPQQSHREKQSRFQGKPEQPEANGMIRLVLDFLKQVYLHLLKDWVKRRHLQVKSSAGLRGCTEIHEQEPLLSSCLQCATPMVTEAILQNV